jgi:hypothetical protein
MRNFFRKKSNEEYPPTFMSLVVLRQATQELRPTWSDDELHQQLLFLMADVIGDEKMSEIARYTLDLAIEQRNEISTLESIYNLPTYQKENN